MSDATFALLFILTTLASYVLWATDRASRTRWVLGLTAVVCFVLAVVARTYWPVAPVTSGLP